MAPESIQGIGIWKGEGVASDASIAKSIVALIDSARAVRAGASSDLSPSEAAAILARWDQCKRTGSPFAHEQTVLDSAGRTFVVQSIVVPIQLEDGTTRFVGFNIDITDRSGADAQRLAVSALQQHRALEEGSGTWEFDPRTDRFEMNAAGRELLGLPQFETITYSGFVGLLSAMDRGALANAVADARSTKAVSTFEASVGGRPLRIALVATEFGPVSGEIYDNSEELRRTMKLIDLAQEPVLLYDRKLRVVGRNAAAISATEAEVGGTDEILTQCLLSGIQASTELAPGRVATATPWHHGVLLSIHSEQAENCRALDVEQLGTVEPARQLQQALTWLHPSDVRPATDAQREPVLMTGGESLLAGALDHLRLNMAELSSVPTALLRVGADRLGAGERQALCRHVQTISLLESSVERLRLWGDLAEAEPVAESVDLPSLILGHSVLQTYKTLISDLSATSIMADRELCGLALIELLRNAANFAPGAMLTVRTEGQSIFVEDSGLGFPKSVLSAPRKPFTRGPNADNILGDGLGLAICSRIMRAHGGLLKVSNNLVGACVELSFPD